MFLMVANYFPSPSGDVKGRTIANTSRCNFVAIQSAAASSTWLDWAHHTGMLTLLANPPLQLEFQSYFLRDTQVDQVEVPRVQTFRRDVGAAIFHLKGWVLLAWSPQTD